MGKATHMSSVPVSICRLRLSREMQTHETPPLGVFIGRDFADEVRMHNYGKDGDQIQEYPRIQLKVVQSTAVLLGIGDGAEVLKRLWEDVDYSTLGGGSVDILEAGFETYEEEIASTEELVTYRFHTPWLALNDRNFRSYTGSRNTGFRKDELSRILVGNCMGMAKTLGVCFDDRLHAEGRQLVSVKTMLKGKGAIGFIGRFRINARLPDLIGLGRSVSHGFGTLSPEHV